MAVELLHKKTMRVNSWQTSKPEVTERWTQQRNTRWRWRWTMNNLICLVFICCFCCWQDVHNSPHSTCFQWSACDEESLGYIEGLQQLLRPETWHQPGIISYCPALVEFGAVTFLFEIPRYVCISGLGLQISQWRHITWNAIIKSPVSIGLMYSVASANVCMYGVAGFRDSHLRCFSTLSN